MKYFLYIIYSDCIERYYIGITSNITQRITSHNLGFSKKAFTKRANDWRLVYCEEYETKSEALRREREVKGYKGGNSFKKLIGKKYI